ncbi:SEC-C metal-binding domain-containing protein [Polaribacter aestuariivivens]|uniref:SEC-C metal-binding domain-containing protein n=1 Tax=Polaribacter aestuariivivens TaxID=2304626 RepID=UPI003F491F9A
MQKQVKKPSKIKAILLLVKYKIFLPINTIFCSNKIIFFIILRLKYYKLLEKVHQHNIKNRISKNKKDLIKSIKTLYFNTNFLERLYIKNYLEGSLLVADVSTKLKKSQGRNEKCNCGSGLKFKKCCILKY